MAQSLLNTIHQFVQHLDKGQHLQLKRFFKRKKFRTKSYETLYGILFETKQYRSSTIRRLLKEEGINYTSSFAKRFYEIIQKEVIGLSKEELNFSLAKYFSQNDLVNNSLYHLDQALNSSITGSNLAKRTEALQLKLSTLVMRTEAESEEILQLGEAFKKLNYQNFIYNQMHYIGCLAILEMDKYENNQFLLEELLDEYISNIPDEGKLEDVLEDYILRIGGILYLASDKNKRASALYIKLFNYPFLPFGRMIDTIYRCELSCQVYFQKSYIRLFEEKIENNLYSEIERNFLKDTLFALSLFNQKTRLNIETLSLIQNHNYDAIINPQTQVQNKADNFRLTRDFIVGKIYLAVLLKFGQNYLYQKLIPIEGIQKAIHKNRTKSTEGKLLLYILNLIRMKDYETATYFISISRRFFKRKNFTKNFYYKMYEFLNEFLKLDKKSTQFELEIPNQKIEALLLKYFKRESEINGDFELMGLWDFKNNLLAVLFNKAPYLLTRKDKNLINNLESR